MTPTDTDWLDKVVTAQQGLCDARYDLDELRSWIRKFTDENSFRFVDDERVKAVLERDGAQFRYDALSARLVHVGAQLAAAQREGHDIAGIIYSINEVRRAIIDTTDNTRELITSTGAKAVLP
jgi:hypothetical protein